jgi:hypothetical protein
MVQWMDKVDVSLQNIMKEVNTLEEFEKERAVFQVCVNFLLIGTCSIRHYYVSCRCDSLLL